MELKRATKKLLSDSNLRLLSNLIISLSNTTTSVQERCVEPYEDGKVYQAGVSLVLKDSELYFCKVTNQDATWTPSHWELIGKDITEIDLDTVKSWLNLSQEELDNLQSLIDDTAITTTKTNSSSKIYMDIQAAIAECKNDTLKQIAKKVSGSYKIASSTSEVTSADFIYLISNGANYDLYVLVDSVPTRVGDTSVNLDNYYTKTEVDSDFLKKTDATSTYATITTVDGKMDKTDIVDNLTSTDTDKPLSANQGKVLKDEVDLIKANDSNVVKKTDIVTTIDNTSTDDKVPSTKAVFDRCIQGKIIDQSVVDTYGTEILKYPLGRWVITSNVMATNFTDLPKVISGNIDITSINYNNNINPWSNKYAYRVYSFVPYEGGSYVRKLESGNTAGVITNDSGWQKVCTTSVADVPLTTVPLDSSKFSNGHLQYEVKNGTCYVYINALNAKATFLGYDMSSTPMPRPSSGLATAPIVSDSNGVNIGLFYVDASFNSTPRCHIFTASLNGYVAFSYTVAES